MDVRGIGQAIVGIVLLAFLPGWVWSRILVPGLGRLERFVASVALSLVLMVLVLYLGSTVGGIPVSATHAVWWALALSLAGWAAAGLTRRSTARPPIGPPR